MEEQFALICNEYKENNIALNATGGTKSMVIAGNNIFRKNGKAIFYLEAKTNKVSFLYQLEDGSYIPDIELESEITLKTYLASYGVKSESTFTHISHTKLNAMVAAFINGYNTFNPYVYKLNWYGGKIKDYKAELTKEDLSDPNFIKLLTQLAQADKGKGVVGFDGCCIDYKGHKDKFFANGGWFEEFVYTKLKSNPNVKDIQCGLHVDNDIYSDGYQDDYNRNELDVVFIAKDKLHIIECKTSQVSVAEGAKILYKLEVLKKYGGTMTKTCLLSYDKVPSAVRKRAKAAGIHIISAFELKDLDKHIMKWIGER